MIRSNQLSIRSELELILILQSWLGRVETMSRIIGEQHEMQETGEHSWILRLYQVVNVCHGTREINMLCFICLTLTRLSADLTRKQTGSGFNLISSSATRQAWRVKSDSPDSLFPFSELLITRHLAPSCHCLGLLGNLLFTFYISSQQDTGNTEMICSNKKPRLRRQIWTFIMSAGQRAGGRHPLTL